MYKHHLRRKIDFCLLLEMADFVLLKSFLSFSVAKLKVYNQLMLSFILQYHLNKNHHLSFLRSHKESNALLIQKNIVISRFHDSLFNQKIKCSCDKKLLDHTLSRLFKLSSGQVTSSISQFHFQHNHPTVPRFQHGTNYNVILTKLVIHSINCVQL